MPLATAERCEINRMLTAAVDPRIPAAAADANSCYIAHAVFKPIPWRQAETTNNLVSIVLQ